MSAYDKLIIGGAAGIIVAAIVGYWIGYRDGAHDTKMRLLRDRLLRP